MGDTPASINRPLAARMCMPRIFPAIWMWDAPSFTRGRRADAIEAARLPRSVAHTRAPARNGERIKRGALVRFAARYDMGARAWVVVAAAWADGALWCDCVCALSGFAGARACTLEGEKILRVMAGTEDEWLIAVVARCNCNAIVIVH